MLEIFFINKTTEDSQLFEKIAVKLINNGLKILQKEQKKITLTVWFVTDQYALELNQEYRKKHYTPDVLSFPTVLSEQEIEAIGYLELGDIVISLAEAKRKASQYHHSLETEVAFLIVHGFLHLLGFDHEKNLEEEKIMFELQDKILATENYQYNMKDF